ncbi:ATP-grasp domain-containing protein [Kordiimonas marina]|uniref:ATP-grasp domain-containing protein n=1 Tax=Kordiimonas marina TaxID=2872312 RepID=UPI001FF5BFBF|nr:hypothetical protein [Kordiimonas marina]MCJ9430225.1 hypothetical protein [Kordiimonas marina]
MRLAFLASRDTLPGSPTRRVDAFEHDQMMDFLEAAFTRHGASVEAVSWDDASADWAAYDAVMIGTAWDYQDRLEEFLATLARIEAVTRLYNPRALVAWNADKRYLRDLEEKGVRLIPTRWADRVTEDVVAAAFADFDTDELVVKRQVGAGAAGQHKLHPGDPVPHMPEPMMIQPFLKAIVEEGELSFIFIGGAFSHALLKTAAAGDYRIQSCYGGQETPVVPDDADIKAAAHALSALEAAPLYARVDMIRAEDGTLRLMEMELIEPFLYPLQGPELGERLYQAIAARVGTDTKGS